MEQAERLQQITLSLLNWYRENARDLPWRREVTPYRVWVSEIMLQQTRVAAVIGYFQRFMDALPDVQALAEVPEEELLKLWQGLGYYNRARNLQRGARQILEDYNGVFPGQYEEIAALSGVGAYTAGAIASIAFSVPVPAVDGNVLRVITRILGDRRDITRPETAKSIRVLLQQVIPVQMPGTYNQALMELGATVCVPNGQPRCELCPAAGLCRASLEGTCGEIPVKAAKKQRRREKRRVFLLFYQGRVALRRRPETGLLAGLWEYPNELWEAESCLLQWGISGMAEETACKGKHVFTHIEWQLEAEILHCTSDALPAGWVWASLRELEQRYAVPNAFRFAEKTVKNHLEKWR